jgi:hypothetical protein
MAPGSVQGRNGKNATVVKGQSARVIRATGVPHGTHLTVPCPSCKVGVGVKCVTAAGKETGTHPSRRRMAIRADNARREAEGTLTVRRGPPQIDTEHGRRCPWCGLMVRLAKKTMDPTLVSHTPGGQKPTQRTEPACAGSRLSHTGWTW